MAQPANKKRGRQAHEIDLERYKPETVDPDDMGVKLPADVPVSLRAFRLMEEVPKMDGASGTCLGLKGWTIQLNAWAHGVKVYLRVGRDGTLKLFVEDENGREKLVEWGKE